MPLTKVKSGGVSDSITLTSPDINAPDIDGGTIDNAVIGGSTAAAGSFTTITATGGSSSNWNTAYGWGDHSTQSYATQTYVGTAVSNLVDSSPAALDTLNELAAALGDDPNFATTVTNSIALKAPLANPSFTGAATFNSTGTFAGGSTNFDNTADVVTLNGSLHTRLLIDTSSTGGHQAAIVLESNGNQSSIGNTGSNTSFAVAAGNLTLDVAGEIILDADQNGVVRINDAGSNFGAFFKNGTTFTLKSELADYDMIFSGNDGGATINALTLDMSAAGAATFNSTVTHTGLTLDYNTSMYGTDKTLSTYSASNGVYLNGNASGWLQLAGDGARNTRINLFGDGNSAANQITFHTNNVHSMSLSAGGAIFNETGIDRDFRVETTANTHALFIDGSATGAGRVTIGGATQTGVLTVQGGTTTEETMWIYGEASGKGGRIVSIRDTRATNGTEGTAGIRLTSSPGTDYVMQKHYDGSSSHWMLTDQSGNEYITVEGASAVVINQGGSSSRDFRVASNAQNHMFFVDASQNRATFGQQTASITSGGMYMDLSNDSQAHMGICISENANNVAGLYINRQTHDGSMIIFRRNNVQRGSIDVTTVGTTYSTTSDRRLKKDIETITDGTDKLMAMNPVTHGWKADPEADAVHGFIAQEMRDIVPEAVSGDPEGEDMMSMDYGRITPVLVAALQDAHKKIAGLETRLNELEGK